MSQSSFLNSSASRSRSRTANGGFTLLEIMIVLAILGMLVALAVTKLGGAFSESQGRVAKLFVQESMETPLTTYRIDVGDYPSTEEGLQALIVAPADKTDRWHGPYVENGKIPPDPWGRPYQYAYPGTHNKDGYDLWSTGKSGQNGGPDNIGNW